MDYDSLTVEELIALRGKHQARARGIYKSPGWWKEFRAKVKRTQ